MVLSSLTVFAVHSVQYIMAPGNRTTTDNLHVGVVSTKLLHHIVLSIVVLASEFQELLRDSQGIVQHIDIIHKVGGLTHAHIRSNIACGLYHFMASAVLSGDGSLTERLQMGLDRGFAFYEHYLADHENLEYYDRMRDLEAFASLPEDSIRSSGYVVDALEAAIWAHANSGSFDGALLKAVNLGDDTDTVGAIAGGLAGVYYGYDAIPEDWLAAIQRREWIEGLCESK